MDFLGGGIFVSSFDSRNAASLTLNNSQVVNNNADIGGGIFNANSSTLRMSASHINNNTAGTYGGLDNQGTATLSASQVNDNTANAGPGGGIGSSGSLTASSTQINGNAAAGSGGGLSNSGTLNLIASLVTGNTASSANGDAHGGGINNTATSQPGTATLTSTSVSNNTVSAPNGSALGGGIYNCIGTTTLRSSTVTDNVATGKTPNGGGIFVSSGSVTLMPGFGVWQRPQQLRPTQQRRRLHRLRALSTEVADVRQNHRDDPAASAEGSSCMWDRGLLANGTHQPELQSLHDVGRALPRPCHLSSRPARRTPRIRRGPLARGPRYPDRPTLRAASDGR